MANNFFKSNNPLLNDKTLDKVETIERTNGSEIITRTGGDVSTVKGAIDRTLMLFVLLMATTIFSYGAPSMTFLYVGIFGGLAVALVASFKPTMAPILAPVYALLEGLAVGSISAMFAYSYDGIVLQAATLTFGTLLAMLVLYRSGLIKVTSKFRMGVMMATGAIMFIYLLSWVGHFVGFDIPFLHNSGPLGIGISLVIIAVASMNLLLDFDMFEKIEQNKMPKYMEWLAAMGLIVTLVWLYWEFLRLLSKFRD